MKAIAAMSENRVIGNKSQIPWRVSGDFKWFKEFTFNKTILVGSNTYKTLPFLPTRKVLVLTTKDEYSYGEPVEDYSVTTISLSKLEIVLKRHEVIVAGGAQIYSLFLPQITEFYITHIKGEYEGDAFMSPFEHLFSRQEVVRTFGEHKVIKYVK